MEFFETYRSAFILLAQFVIAIFLFFLSKKVFNIISTRLSSVLKTTFMRALFSEKTIFNFSFIIPLIFILQGINFLDDLSHASLVLISRVLYSLLAFFTINAISTFLSEFSNKYHELEISNNRPIKGFVQIIKLILWAIGIVVIISFLVDKSPAIFLSGLGALSAVLMLVFKDTILSFVAGVQLISNNLLSVGDWLDMGALGVDGKVVDISLHYVKVEGWNKTTTIIPAHKFLEHTFNNWRGMFESGGRRIKRSIYIDMASIKFLNDEEISSFKKFKLLKDYIEAKEDELSKANEEALLSDGGVLNARRLTNIGTFRAYLKNYLRKHPMIYQEFSLMVRQLQPTPQGLPIELYCFVNDVRWAYYEEVQSDIFDHVFAIIKEFKLNVFQNPSGKDFQTLRNSDE